MAKFELPDSSAGPKFSLQVEPPKTTPGGVSLEPITLQDTLPEVDPTTARQAAEESFSADIERSFDMGTDLKNRGFVIPDDQLKMPSLEGMLSTELKSAYDQSIAMDNTRIEDVLFDIVPEYAGTKKAGVLTLNQKDSLARMPRFEQRQKWFEQQFPSGALFRVDTGGGNLVELYKTSPAGKVYRVSDDVLSFGDIGSVTGSLVNFTTAGSVIGSIFAPFLGTAGGAYIGATIDEYIANALATDKLNALGIGSEEEFKTRLIAGDRAVVSLLDGVITKVLPGMGRAGKHLFDRATLGKAEGSILYELGIFSVNPKAAAAQQAARSLSSATGAQLQPLNVSQLSNNVLLRGIASQISGTAGKLPQNLSTQEGRLFSALQKKVDDSGGDFGVFDQTELYNYIRLANKGLADDVFNTFRAYNTGNYALRDVPDSALSLIENAKAVDKGFSRAIDSKYQEAFSLSGSDNVTFDLTNIIKTAEDIKLGVQATKKPEGGRNVVTGQALDKDKKFTSETGTRTRDFGGELGTLVNKITQVFDPTVKTFKVKGVAGQSDDKTFSSFQQLKDIRDQAQDLVNNGENRALDLVKAIDDLIINGIENGQVQGGSDAWRKAFLEAGSLVKQRSDVKRFTQIGQIFGPKGEVVPEEIAIKFINGGLNTEQWNILKRMVNTTSLNESEKLSGQALLQDIKEAGLAYIIRNPDNAAAKIAQLKKVDDGALFNQLFDKPVRESLKEFESTARMLATDPVQAVLKGNYTNGQASLQYIRSIKGDAQDLAVRRFIDANGGINGEAANQTRAALLNDILEKASVTKLDPTSAEHSNIVINSEILATELNKLKNFQGEYAGFKSLFGTLDDAGNLKIKPSDKKYFDLITDAQLYSSFLATTADVGGPFATGAIRSAVTSGKLTNTIGAAKTILTNKYLSAIFGAKPSVEQLERALGQKKHEGKVRAGITLLNQWVDGLNLEFEEGAMTQTAPPGFETPKEERSRTGAPPTPYSSPQASLNISPPPVSPMPNVATQPTTDFASLFPRDELGGAIARRGQGIMSLG